ncbi:hypothetical protein FisN_4Lh422 [Fistulifera solaris]|uniref:Autophagy-related protein 101 n=1 Tax=Fistulifera solaris TaxID=1519565 RepID=A0A1Z5KEC3_FISSO|nr:hypothetical protein FisN_4Lh422 [Fistulifera solaris]|eukprot:GAX24308.1 hypothetical protein FisN_4Lh422 [Fistulifera solaris]
MNCKEHYLPELELSTAQVRSALQCILHTILFLRSPGPVTPKDVECEDFNLTYARIANNHQNQPPNKAMGNIVHSLENDIDQKVDDAIESFLRTLSQIGPELLSGCLTVSFFERRATRQLFGLVSHEERVVFEQWVMRVVVNNTPRPISNDSAALMERQRIQVRQSSKSKSGSGAIFCMHTMYH